MSTDQGARESLALEVRLHAITIGIEATDAAWECAHGRLFNDKVPAKDGMWPHARPCGCWPGESPAIRTDFTTTRKEPAVSEPIHAPFGVKTDGTPRKRPAPTPETIAKQQATKATRKAAMQLASPPANPEPSSSAAPAKATVNGSLLIQVIDEIGTEIERLELAREALRAVIA